MELKEDNEETKITPETVVVPNIRYKTLKEAEEMLKECKLKINYDGEIINEEKKNIIIKEQVPSAGITINSESKVLVSF